MTPLIKNILTFVIVAAVLYGVYLLVSALNLTDATFQRAEDVRAETTELEQGILADITALDALTMDASFLSSPEYQALNAVTLPDTDFPASRENPFLPVR